MTLNIYLIVVSYLMNLDINLEYKRRFLLYRILQSRILNLMAPNAVLQGKVLVATRNNVPPELTAYFTQPWRQD